MQWLLGSSSPSFDGDHSSNTIHSSHDAKESSGFTHRLPPELLAEIFLIGLESLSAQRKDYTAVNTYLVRLTAVCAFWRSMAISTPTLWAKIRCIYYTPKKIGRVAAFLRMQLERSQKVLLDLELVTGYSSDTRSTARVVGIIYPHLHRCHTIALELYNARDRRMLLPLPGPLKNLTSLAIGDRGECLRKKCIITSTDTPILRNLEYMAPLTALRAMQTSNLTHILLEGGTLGGAMGILSRCPAAQSVVITTRIKRFDVFPRPFTLSDLTLFSAPRELAMVFQHIVKTPKLEELYLDTLGELDRLPDINHLRVLPIQGLKKVTLIDTILSYRPEELYDFLVWHPGIEQLTLRRCGDPFVVSAMLVHGHKKDTAYDPLLQELGLPEDYGPLLPSLTMLCFQCTTGASNSKRNKLLGACVIDLLELRPTLSFAASASEQSFSHSEVQLGEIEARFGDRFSNVPRTRPIGVFFW